MAEDQDQRIETKVRVPKSILDDLKKFGGESGLPLNQVMIDSFEEKIRLWKSGRITSTDDAMEVKEILDQLITEIRGISAVNPDNLQKDGEEGYRKVEAVLRSLQDQLHSCQGTILKTLKDAINESSQAGESTAKTIEEAMTNAGAIIDTITSNFKNISSKPAGSSGDPSMISKKTIMGTVVAAMTAGMLFFGFGILVAPKSPPDPRLKDIGKYELGWRRYEEVRSILEKLPQDDRKRIIPFVAQQMMELERKGEK